MDNSLRFKFISKNTSLLIKKCIENDNFVKLIRDLSNDPRNSTTPMEELRKDIIDFGDNQGIIQLNEFHEELVKEKKIIIFFSPWSSDIKDTMTANDTVLFNFDIVVPNEYWILRGLGELRAYEIAHEIANSLDNKSFEGIGKVEIAHNWFQGKIKTNSTYSMLRLFVSAKQPNRKVLINKQWSK